MRKKENNNQLWTKPLCASCMLNIGYSALKKSTEDKELQYKCMKEIFNILKLFSNDVFPVDLSIKIFRMLQKSTKNMNPYDKEKKLSNKLGKTVSELIKLDIIKSQSYSERIKKAIIGTIVGNIIDFSTAQHQFNLDVNEFNDLYSHNLETGFKINDFEEFISLLDKIETILYVLDNAGEIAFDKLLIEELLAIGKTVIIVLKEGSIANDATLEDAQEVGLDKLGVELLTTGSNALGVMFNEVSEEFMQKLENSDLIISKGQSNWECFTYFKEKIKIPILFILRAKCSPIAEFLGVNVGDNVLKLIKKIT